MGGPRSLSGLHQPARERDPEIGDTEVRLVLDLTNIHQIVFAPRGIRLDKFSVANFAIFAQVDLPQTHGHINAYKLSA